MHCIARYKQKWVDRNKHHTATYTLVTNLQNQTLTKLSILTNTTSEIIRSTKTVNDTQALCRTVCHQHASYKQCIHRHSWNNMVKLSRDEILKTMITVNAAQSLNCATQLHEQKKLDIYIQHNDGSVAETQSCVSNNRLAINNIMFISSHCPLFVDNTLISHWQLLPPSTANNCKQQCK